MRERGTGRGRIGVLATALVIAGTGAAATTTAVAESPSEMTSIDDVESRLDAGEADALRRLQRSIGSDGTTAVHAATGKLRFVGTSPGQVVDLPAGARVRSTEAGVEAFLDAYGAAFGIGRPDDLELVGVSGSTGPEATVHTARYRQTHRGVPVFGGELTVQLDGANRVLSALGEIVPDLDLDPRPTTSPSAAADSALAVTAKHREVDAGALTASTPELVVYNPVVLGGPAGAHQALDADFLAWQVEVTPTSAATPVRELVLVDAHRDGAVLLNFGQITPARSRIVCDNANLAGESYACPATVNAAVRSEGQPPVGVSEVNLAYDYAGDTYDFFQSRFRRDSLDDDGMQLVSTVRHCPDSSSCPYQNAFWDGAQMVYGDGFAAADDVVGHELTHGVTEFSSGLFYYYQSGAINEALSDVFGEFVDLTNGAGTDTAAARWRLGEDLPGSGAIRDMQHPPNFGDPDRMGSPLYYAGSGFDFMSGGEDNGGVHFNSGVLNKAVYLMTDGDTFNGRTVTGLGLTKVARIVHDAATGMLTSGSDYADLYDALRQSCANLVGIGGITAGNCNQVQQALLAVEMNQQPSSGTTMTAPVCAGGQIPTNLFADDMEDPASGNWTDNDPTTPVHVTGYAHAGDVSLYRPDHNTTTNYATTLTTSAAVTIPAGGAFLRFAHAFEFEAGAWDGGIVEYSTNNGSTWTNAGPLFTHGGYNGTIFGGPAGFVNVSHGYGASRLDLSSLASQAVRFRFRASTDSSIGDLGWVIDDLRVFTCGTPDSLRFVPIEPCAVFDTRSADGALAGPHGGGDVLTFDVASNGALPAGQGAEACTPPPAAAQAVELNLVAVQPPGSGNLQVSARGVVPDGGVVNFSPGITNSSSVPVGVDDQGRIDVGVGSASSRATHVRGVALGYYLDPADAGPSVDDLLFVPSAACAVFDTRFAGGGGRFDGGETRTYEVAGTFDPTTQGGQACAEPPPGAIAALVNLVAILPTSSGNLRAVAAGGVASGGVVNFSAFDGNNSNAVPVGLSTGGDLDVTANANGDDVVEIRGVVLGHYVDGDHPDAGAGMELVPTAACAVFDTRHGTGVFGARIDDGQTLTPQVVSNINVPPGQGAESCAPPPEGADAVMLNLVTVGPNSNGNLQLAPAGVAPEGGVVNFSAERGTNSNAVAAGLTDGRVDVIGNTVRQDATHVRGVALGYFVDPTS